VATIGPPSLKTRRKADDLRLEVAGGRCEEPGQETRRTPGTLTPAWRSGANCRIMIAGSWATLCKEF
jgi:hypothetical protein